MPLTGGDETEVVNEVSGWAWPNWAVTSRGIYFLRSIKSDRDTVKFFDFATLKTVPIWSIEKGTGWGIGLSQDGKSIAYIQNEFVESNIMLVKNFR